ncbi:MAG TPA: hypothetical protein VGL09_22100 [Methylomirabilota bacterium]|jgi:hypothetical protein
MDNLPALTRLLRLLPALMLVSWAAAAGAQPADRDSSRRPAEVENIEAYVRGIDLLAESGEQQGGRFRLFALFAPARGKTPSWREFADEAVLDETIKAEQPSTVALARVFMRAGAVAAVYTSVAGEDGVVWTDHYFRADGTLAKLETRWRTLGAELQMERERFFDGAAQVLWSRVELVDLAAGTPVPRLRPGISEPKPEIYLRADRLPYHALLRRAPDVTPRGATP